MAGTWPAAAWETWGCPADALGVTLAGCVPAAGRGADGGTPTAGLGPALATGEAGATGWTEIGGLTAWGGTGVGTVGR
jgi:hypothetical protein